MILVGVALLLQTLHLWVFGTLVATFWPLAIVAVGLLAWRSNPREWLMPVVIVLVGVVLQLQRLGILSLGFWQVFWPLVVIVFGVSLVMGHATPGTTDSGDDKVALYAAFSGIDAKNVSTHFLGGKLTGMFGGIKLDLTQAKLAPRAEMEVFVMFGGAEIRVPKEWKVHMGGLPLMGGWDDKTAKPAPGAPELIVHSTAIFGGVEVKN